MKVQLSLLVTCLFVAASLSSADDETQLKQAIEDYVVGWRDADPERLAKVFALDNGHLIWTTGDDGSKSVASMTFEEILARTKRTRPEYGRSTEIVSLDIVDGQLAVAKVKLSYSGGSYVDYLVFYKVDDAWKIVTKTFVSRRDAQPK